MLRPTVLYMFVFVYYLHLEGVISYSLCVKREFLAAQPFCHRCLGSSSLGNVCLCLSLCVAENKLNSQYTVCPLLYKQDIEIGDINQCCEESFQMDSIFHPVSPRKLNSEPLYNTETHNPSGETQKVWAYTGSTFSN